MNEIVFHLHSSRLFLVVFLMMFFHPLCSALPCAMFGIISFAVALQTRPYDVDGHGQKLNGKQQQREGNETNERAEELSAKLNKNSVSQINTHASQNNI